MISLSLVVYKASLRSGANQVFCFLLALFLLHYLFFFFSSLPSVPLCFINMCLRREGRIPDGTGTEIGG